MGAFGRSSGLSPSKSSCNDCDDSEEQKIRLKQRPDIFPNYPVFKVIKLHCVSATLFYKSNSELLYYEDGSETA